MSDGHASSPSHAPGAGAGAGAGAAGAALDELGIGHAVLDALWRCGSANAAAERITGTPPGHLLGRSVWEAVPALAGGDAERHCRAAAASGERVTFEVHHPGAPDQRVEVRAVPEGPGGGLALFFTDVTARRALERTQALAARRQSAAAAMGEAALALLEAHDVAGVVAVLAEQGHHGMDCDGAVLNVVDPDDPHHLVSTTSSRFDAEFRTVYARVPLDAPLPLAHAARTGQRVLLADAAASRAWSPECAAVVEATGQQAFACLPLRAGGRLLGVLSAGWTDAQPFDAPQVEVLEAYAAQCAQALQRVAAREAEHAAAEAARRSAAQQAALVAIAQALAGAQSEPDVLEVVADHGVRLLGAAGAALSLLEADGTTVRVLSTPASPASSASPASPATGAAASLPLRAGDHVLGSLSLTPASPRPWDPSERELVAAFAALTAQALERITARDAERAASAVVAGFSEVLQRSMLTEPPHLADLQIAVRYTPATAHAEVGGDWYDAFTTATGTTSVVIGDVTGHDMAAAAAMGQLRNLLRGIAYAVGQPPAAVLATLDRAAQAMGVAVVATAVLAQVEQDAAHRAVGARLLRWSNAGHLPPLLVEPTGEVRYLQARTDLLLGWDPRTTRHDHEVLLRPGATVLLYTDGLVERRRTGLEPGLAWLAGAVGELVGAGAGPEELCDALLELVDGHLDDDVALLALRTPARP